MGQDERAANFASQKVSRWRWKPTIDDPVRPRNRKEIERDDIRARQQKMRDQGEQEWQKRLAELKKLQLPPRARIKLKRSLSRPAREGRYVSFDCGIEDNVARFRVNQEGFEVPVIRSGRVMDEERARASQDKLENEQKERETVALPVQEIPEAAKVPEKLIIEPETNSLPTPEELEEMQRQRRMDQLRSELKTTMADRAERIQERKNERGRSR